MLRGGPAVSQPRIVYYKDDSAFRNGAEASGQVALRGALAKMTTVMNPAMMGGDEQVSFEVQAAQRTLPLRVGADEAQEWIDAINQAVAHTKAQRRQRRPRNGGAAAADGGAAAGGAVANPAMGASAGPIMNPAAAGDDDDDAQGPAANSGPVKNPFLEGEEADDKTLADFADDHTFKMGWLLKRSGGSVAGKGKVSCAPLPFLDLPLPFLDLPLPFLDLPLPFLDLSLPFLDLPLPFQCLSLDFECRVTTAFRSASVKCEPSGTGGTSSSTNTGCRSEPLPPTSARRRASSVARIF